MFKKVLIPTDGSEPATAAALEGVAFAKACGAEVVGVFASQEYQYPVFVEIVPPTYPVESEYKNLMKRIGSEYLQKVREACEKEGIKYSQEVLFSDSPGTALADYATQAGCDLIFMGSHGRSGIGSLLLGSVTQKVLNMCKIPVLVHQFKKD